MDLSKAKAVVTGGASGLGFATAQRVIDAGGMAEVIRNALIKHLAELEHKSIDQLLEERQVRLAGYGQYKGD